MAWNLKLHGNVSVNSFVWVVAATHAWTRFGVNIVNNCLYASSLHFFLIFMLYLFFHFLYLFLLFIIRFIFFFTLNGCHTLKKFMIRSLKNHSVAWLLFFDIAGFPFQLLLFFGLQCNQKMQKCHMFNYAYYCTKKVANTK